jgi:hypothetical protein
MDGALVNPGDWVHDILFGPGQVNFADSTQIQVRFGADVFTYSPDGSFGQVRRLYWADPILEAPPKNDKQRPLVLSLIRAVRHHVM